MRGNPDPSRVRDALPIDHDKIGRNPELFKSLDNEGHLTEGKVAGNVGEIQLAGSRRNFSDGKLRPVQNDNGGFRLDGETSGGDIDSRDVAGADDFTLPDNRSSESFLDAAGFFKDSPANHGASEFSSIYYNNILCNGANAGK